jgi:TPR repeat protein
MKTVVLVTFLFAASALLHGAEVTNAPIKPPAPLTVAPVLAKPAEKQPLPAAASVKTNAAPTPSLYTEHDTMLEFQKASAKKGFAQSEYVMALRYLSGNGVPKDETQARQLLEAAAKQGHVKARQKLQELKHADKGT